MDAADLTLEDLTAGVERRLEALGLLAAQGDRRVSATPDGRTVRYYTTLGLLDPPAIRDRQARYGHRQVLQLAAIKALQARRLPLGEIQRRLHGRSDAELETLLGAAVPPSTLAVRTTAGSGPFANAVCWREVTLEPGLRLMVEDGWAPQLSAEALVERLRATLAELAAPPRGTPEDPRR